MLPTRPDPYAAEQNKPDDDEGEQENQEAGRGHRQVVDASSELRRPQGEQADDDRTNHHERSENPIMHRNWVVNPNVSFVAV